MKDQQAFQPPSMNVVLAIVLTALIAVTVVFTLARNSGVHRSSEPPRAGVRPSPGQTFPPAATVSTGTAGSATSPRVPAPVAQPTTTSIDSRGSQEATIRSQGYAPSRAAPASVSDGSGGTIVAWLATCVGSADGHCQKVFFFVNSRYLGTDTSGPSSLIEHVVGGGPRTILVTYGNYARDDPLCCPTGPPVTVQYRWSGHRLVPNRSTGQRALSG